MGWEFTLGSEVIRRGDEAAAEVMFPDAIDEHAGDQTAAAVDRVGEPLREGDAGIGSRSGCRGRSRLRRSDWSSGSGGTAQDLEEAGVGFAEFLVHFAAAEEKDVLAAGGGGVHFGEFGARGLARVFGDGGGDFLRGIIVVAEPTDGVVALGVDELRGEHGLEFAEVLGDGDGIGKEE